MMTQDRRVAEVRQRTRMIAARAKLRATRFIAYTSCAVLAGIAVLVGMAGAGDPAPGETGILFGASLFDVGMGGYVLVGIACAAVAVAITLACMRHRDRRDEESGKALE